MTTTTTQRHFVYTETDVTKRRHDCTHTRVKVWEILPDRSLVKICDSVRTYESAFQRVIEGMREAGAIPDALLTQPPSGGYDVWRSSHCLQMGWHFTEI